MNSSNKILMDRRLAEVLDLIDSAANELGLSKTDKDARFICGQIVEFETELFEIRHKIYRFKEMAKEIYSE